MVWICLEGLGYEKACATLHAQSCHARELRFRISWVVLLQIPDQSSKLGDLCQQAVDEALQDGFVLSRDCIESI